MNPPRRTLAIGHRRFRIDRDGDRLCVQEVGVTEDRMSEHLRLPATAWPHLIAAVRQALAGGGGA